MRIPSEIIEKIAGLVLERLKSTFDPNGVIAPGRYGVG